jgi:hypothetical protein
MTDEREREREREREPSIHKKTWRDAGARICVATFNKCVTKSHATQVGTGWLNIL